MKLKKGSPEAKRFMAKLRAAKNKSKPVGKAKAKAKKVVKKLKIGNTNNDYYIVDKNGKFLTRSTINSNYIFTDNYNFAYSFNINDAKNLSQQLSKISEYKKNTPINPIKKSQAKLNGEIINFKKIMNKKVGPIPKKTIKKAALPKMMHKDTKSHNVNIRVMSGLKKLIGVEPHKAKYFIVYKRAQIENTEYFDKLPAGRYKGMDNIIYLMRGTDSGTALIPLIEAKSNKPVKR